MEVKSRLGEYGSSAADVAAVLFCASSEVESRLVRQKKKIRAVKTCRE
jgi:hypothetical protein